MSRVPILREIEQSLDDTGSINEEAFSYLVGSLGADRASMVMAALILTSLPKEWILKLIEPFPTFSYDAKLALVPLLAAVEDCHEVYNLLFEQLRDTDDAAMALVITKSLGNTEYLIFPILIFYLKTGDIAFTKRLKEVIRSMGFSKLAPLLSVFPNIPEEGIFREIFGDAAIESIYQKK